jgi:hypothetical protein
VTGPGFVLDLTNHSDGSGSNGEQAGADLSAPEALLMSAPPPSWVVGRWDPMPPVATLVPNMTAYSHEASEQGLAGAALGKLKRAGPRTIARVGTIGMADPLAALRMELGVLVKVLLELDLHDFRRYRPQRLVLAGALTDLALAADNGPFFRSFCRHVQKKLHVEPWLETWNAGHLLRRIREWGIPVAGVVTPLNPRGYMMRPTLETCLDEMRSTNVAIWARDITADGAVGFDEGVAFAESLGVKAVVIPGLPAAEPLIPGR